MKTKYEHILTFSEKMQISAILCFATCDWFCLMTSHILAPKLELLPHILQTYLFPLQGKPNKIPQMTSNILRFCSLMLEEKKTGSSRYFVE